MRIHAGRTTPLAFTIWMPRIDTPHAVTIPSPTTADTVVTTPRIPGLELRLPRGTVIRDHDGQVVRELSITPIPLDRTPFPLPEHFEPPVYFTIQPGGAYVHVYGSSTARGAQLVYPNTQGFERDIVAEFWQFDPEEKGWYVYGTGALSENARQVMPNATTAIYEFTGAMINGLLTPPSWWPGLGPLGGDPVDLSTGLFVLEHTDLFLPDVIPMAVTRTYRPNDSQVRPFGRGATHPFAIFLWSAQQYEEADLILPDGFRVHYERTSSGTGFTDAVFEHTSSPTAFYKSTIRWNHKPGWDLTLKDGTVYVFGENAPLQSIRDRYGNSIVLTWSAVNTQGSGYGNILKVASSSGRFFAFTYDGSDRITQVTDNLGRTVGYQYDGSGRLWKVTDTVSGVTEYTYDGSHRMLTIKDARGM
jgi:YD repeat-containing protein